MTPEEKAIWLINTFGEHTENKDFFGDKTRYNMKVVILVRFNKEEDPDLSGQSERQKENNDYNDNYH